MRITGRQLRQIIREELVRESMHSGHMTIRQEIDAMVDEIVEKPDGIIIRAFIDYLKVRDSDPNDPIVSGTMKQIAIRLGLGLRGRINYDLLGFAIEEAYKAIGTEEERAQDIRTGITSPDVGDFDVPETAADKALGVGLMHRIPTRGY
jgi:hypothetical protein